MRGRQVLRQPGHAVRGLCRWALSAERRAGGVCRVQRWQVLPPRVSGGGRVQGCLILPNAVIAGGVRGGRGLLPSGPDPRAGADRGPMPGRALLR